MPKKIDHNAYRTELAQAAIPLFSQYGYHGLGMRKIAEQLGISKSALYHYFPNKQALFHACTDLLTQFEPELQPDSPVKNADSSDEKITTLVNIIQQLEPTFPGEISLLFDYLRDLNSQQIASDASMQLANQRYENLVRQFINDKDSKPVLCLLMGTLLMRYFDGGQTSFDEINSWLVRQLADD